MSTIPIKNPRAFEQDGAPLSPTIRRDWITGPPLYTFGRFGEYLASDVLDIHPAEIVDKTGCPLPRGRWKDNFTAHVEPLSTIPALRPVLDYAPHRRLSRSTPGRTVCRQARMGQPQASPQTGIGCGSPRTRTRASSGKRPCRKLPGR